MNRINILDKAEERINILEDRSKETILNSANVVTNEKFKI